MKRTVIILSVLLTLLSTTLQAQEIPQKNGLKGIFYQFCNIGILKSRYSKFHHTESIYFASIIYLEKEHNRTSRKSITRNKVEIKKGKYSYICTSEPHTSIFVTKLKLIENGNYGIYLMNNYKEKFYHSINEIKQDIETDTTNVQIGTFYCESEFNKFYNLKDISKLTKDDFVSIVKNMAEDLRQTIYSINADDKKELEEWIVYHGYIQASNCAKSCVKFGYNPIFDFAVFADLFKNEEYANALNDANVNLRFFEENE